MSLKFEQTFRVEGNGCFPFDMLRYDHCFPEHETESRLLARDDGGEFRQVGLKRYVELSGDRPTFGRWRSFDWTVIESSISTRRLP